MMIYIVIPTFNEKEFVKDLIERFSNQTISSFKIIVSDNGSSDGTDKMIINNYPNVKLISNDESYWWTKSTNAGIKYALKHAKNDNNNNNKNRTCKSSFLSILPSALRSI